MSLRSSVHTIWPSMELATSPRWDTPDLVPNQPAVGWGGAWGRCGDPLPWPQGGLHNPRAGFLRTLFTEQVPRGQVEDGSSSGWDGPLLPVTPLPHQSCLGAARPHRRWARGLERFPGSSAVPGEARVFLVPRSG